MTSIIISSNDDELSHTIGHETSHALGWRHLNRDFLTEVAKRYDVEKEELQRAIYDGSVGRIKTQRCGLLLAYIATLTLEEFESDEVVCTGLAAHLYLRDVAHVLMVRALGEPNNLTKRIAAEKSVSQRKAKKLLEKNEASRVKWSMEHFGLDESDPSSYDMVLKVGHIDTSKLVDMIVDLANYRKFQAMTYSRIMVRELSLASKVRVALMPKYPDIKVKVVGTRAVVHVSCSKGSKGRTRNRVKDIVTKIEGIDSVEVHADSSVQVAGKIWKALPFG